MTKCWFKNNDEWEVGELFSWTTRWHPDYFCYYYTAVIRRANGDVRYVQAIEVRWEEPEDWSEE